MIDKLSKPYTSIPVQQEQTKPERIAVTVAAAITVGTVAVGAFNAAASGLEAVKDDALNNIGKSLQEDVIGGSSRSSQFYEDTKSGVVKIDIPGLTDIGERGDR
jgi:hypothetical protein